MPFLDRIFPQKHLTQKSERKEYRRDQYSYTIHFLLFISETYQKYLKIQKPKMACSPFSPFRRGSLTIEAALVVPIMILLMYGLIYPVRIMGVERRIQNNMEQAAKQLAAAEYVTSTGAALINWKQGSEELTDQLGTVAEGVIGSTEVLLTMEDRDRKLLRSYVMDPVGLKSLGNDKDPAMVRMDFYYYLDIPGLPQTLWDYLRPMQITASRRAWVGSEGGRGREQYGNGSTREEEDDPYVYLGKTSTSVYHVRASCHYISNEVISTSAATIGILRNKSGGKYHACPSCRPGTSGTVYYFPNGDAYHSSPDCKAITAYVQKKHLSEVSGMRACSYCGKG